MKQLSDFFLFSPVLSLWKSDTDQTRCNQTITTTSKDGALYIAIEYKEVEDHGRCEEHDEDMKDILSTASTCIKLPPRFWSTRVWASRVNSL